MGGGSESEELERRGEVRKEVTEVTIIIKRNQIEECKASIDRDLKMDPITREVPTPQRRVDLRATVDAVSEVEIEESEEEEVIEVEVAEEATVQNRASWPPTLSTGL